MNKEEDLFHLFIQYADKLPIQASFFPHFQFMDQSIRKSFNQLKKTIKKDKQLNAFEQFWNELTNEDRVKLYCNWVILLKKSLELEKNITFKLEPQSMTIQDQIFIRKVSLFNKLEKKIAKLTPTHLHIIGKNDHQYQLKFYQIRKSRSKETFSWVLKSVINNGKPLHCQVNSQSMFDEWYYALSVNINNQRVQYFLNSIKQQKLNPGSIRRQFDTKIEKDKQKQNDKDKQKDKIKNSKNSQKITKQDKKQINKAQEESKNKQIQKKESKKMDAQQNIQMSKTLTQIMINKQMNPMQNSNVVTQKSDEADEFESVEDQNEANNIEKQQKINSSKTQDPQINPNIFKRLAPEYQSLVNFADTPYNSSLIHCDSEYRIYELPHKGNNEQIVLKMFTIFPFPKNLVFQAIASEPKGWNDQIDVFSVKTNISSQNTILIYEKNKSYGLLYRERDFLYLRHCFSVVNIKQKNTFIIDKSIDSIHHPPFMSLVRAEKRLIWGLIQKQNKKECILAIQGWIKGGGYMNQAQNKQITLKYMKKIVNLKGFLKQLSFTQNKNMLFREDWCVDFNKEDPIIINASDIQANYNQSEPSERDIEQKKQTMKQKIFKEKSFQQQAMDEFMKRTSQQNCQVAQGKSEVLISEDTFGNKKYIPPQFTKQRFVIIPQKYLKSTHILVPKQKSAKPKLYPHIRGHHLWKGEWEVLAAGGLGYVDQQKMKEQKKVLTYIIKRIGKNIFSGKGILNISLPVDIFCVQSNIERLAMSFGFFPFYLQKAAEIKEPHLQLKYVLGSGIASSLIYMTMEKPFNPILGQTYQCWTDGCPIYFQQISHHPPIAAFLMKGRGYTVSGCVEAKMDLSINSGTGNNEGIFMIQFDNGNTFYYTTPAGCLSGLTYGERKLNMVGKSFYWNAEGLFLQINYNPASKTKGFFSAAKGQGDEKLPDYFQGYIKQYRPQVVKEIAFKTSQNKLIPIIPKSAPTGEALQTYTKVYGRWNKYVKYGQQIVFDVDENRYYSHKDEEYPLPSHSNYREDIVYRRMRNFIESQQFKQVLQIKQREDRKLRAKFNKDNSH